MSENKKQFQIHLPGLLKVLAESLYSSKKVGIRELIQNAHDSCVRRQVEAKEKYYKPRIAISFDATNRSIIIKDNGSGLTEDEVTEYLSTIGRSYTRQLGENLAIFNPEEASRLVGQFGLGFLSAFLIAEEVILTTKSYKEGSQAILWRSAGDVHYDVSVVEDAEVGTQVELRVKPEASFLLNERVMIDTVQSYADFLEIPVTVGDKPEPVNAMMPPWEAIDPDTAMREYTKRAFSQSDPLAIIPLHDQEINLGHDTMTIPLEGFLFVPPGSLASVHEYGDVSIYIRRMFITDNHTRLLPNWAKFLRGVVDCPYLQPTASREDIQQDEMFFKVQKALDEQITQGLREIAKTDPMIWKQIVRGHRYLIMGWSVKDDAFFKEVMDIITFHTPDGQKTLPEYLEETGGTIYYIEQRIGSQQDKLLGAGYGVPVIDAPMTLEPEFLRKYAHMNQDVKVVHMDSDANSLLKAVPEDEFESLINYFSERRIRARIVAFKPTDVPVIISYPKDAEFIKGTRDALDKGDLPAPFAGLIGDYMENMEVDEDALAGIVHLNASSPLIQRLAKMTDTKERNSALELVYQMGRIFAGRMLNTSDITQAFKMSAESIQNLLGDD
ncbi:MAG: ATP-binding protein [Phototrophicaceae bacterium]